MNWWGGLAALGGLVLVMAAAVGWDRWRERYRRDPASILPVVDRRTLHDALRCVERLDLDRPEHWRAAVGHLVAARVWLLSEIRIGPRRRALGYAVHLEAVELKLQQIKAPSGLYS
ncbi:hypothetical protein [Micromonospora sp. RP3T]|uniref:hypothetical protein n=1 Tax=Micromonospora sp. RP3T TaxID=2135446 RepID=UPI003D75813E